MTAAADPLVTIILGATLGGLAGAAVSGGLTWWVARGQREHERTEAREARRQSRYEQTYVDVLEHTFLIDDFVGRTHPMMTFDGAPGPPAFPDEQVMRRLNARTAVFGSQALLEKLRELNKAVSEFQAAAWKMDFEKQHPTGDVAEIWRELDETRQAVRRVHAELMTLANAELDARQG